MPFAIPFGFGDRESVVLNLDLPAKSDSGYDWISCRAHIKAGGFNACVDLYLEGGDFPAFYRQIETLYRDLKGEAVFLTLEGQIYLKLTGDGRGHIKLQGELLDRGGRENKLTFEINYDQTLLWQSVSALRDVVALIQTKGTSPAEPQ